MLSPNLCASRGMGSPRLWQSVVPGTDHLPRGCGVAWGALKTLMPDAHLLMVRFNWVGMCPGYRDFKNS